MTHTDSEEHQVAKQTEEELEAEHDARILASRIALYNALSHVDTALTEAQGALQDLHAGSFDAEYEGPTEFGRYVGELRRLLDITRGLMPTGPQGDFEKEITVMNAAFRATRTDSCLK